MFQRRRSGKKKAIMGHGGRKVGMGVLPIFFLIEKEDDAEFFRMAGKNSQRAGV